MGGLWQLNLGSFVYPLCRISSTNGWKLDQLSNLQHMIWDKSVTVAFPLYFVTPAGGGGWHGSVPPVFSLLCCGLCPAKLGRKPSRWQQRKQIERMTVELENMTGISKSNCLHLNKSVTMTGPRNPVGWWLVVLKCSSYCASLGHFGQLLLCSQRLCMKNAHSWRAQSKYLLSNIHNW